MIFFIKRQNFIFGDGTVYYAHRKETPIFLKRDNPNLKVLFVTRSPISRFVSQFNFDAPRLLKNNINNTNDLVLSVLHGKNSELIKLHDLAKDIIYLSTKLSKVHYKYYKVVNIYIINITNLTVDCIGYMLQFIPRLLLL